MSENVDWRYWVAAGTTTLDEASLLSLGLAPPAPSRYNEDLTGEAANRVSMAGRYLQSGASVDWLVRRHERACQDVGKSLVSLPKFGAWLKSSGHDLPDGFPLPLNAATAERLESLLAPSGAPKKNEPPAPVGMPSAEIIEKFRLGKEWNEKLRKPDNYKFLMPPVLAQRGRRGGESHRWDPARFGEMLIAKHERNQTAISEVIYRHFTGYSDAWDAILANKK